jgi:hypothetical protein
MRLTLHERIRSTNVAMLLQWTVTTLLLYVAACVLAINLSPLETQGNILNILGIGSKF